MKKLVLALAAITVVALTAAACGGKADSSEPPAFGLEGGVKSGTTTPRFPAPLITPAPTPAPAPLRGPAGPAGPAGAPGPTGDRALQPPDTGGAVTVTAFTQADRQVIQTASVALEVRAVDSAAQQIRAIAESLGGTVQQLASSGKLEERRATITVRVPQAGFFNAMERIAALGLVLSQNAGSQDVTEQVIDLEARIKSSQRQEESLLALLSRAQSVSDVLTIERELSRIRGEIERQQAQLNFIKRQTAQATITVSLTLPRELAGAPPAGTLRIDVKDVSRSVGTIETLVASLKGLIDNVSISVRQGNETASVSMRVFRPDFERAVSALEDLGQVQEKSVTRGVTPDGATEQRGAKPDAVIQVALGEPEDEEDNQAWAIAAGVIVLVAVLGSGTAGGYVWARRRARKA